MTATYRAVSLPLNSPLVPQYEEQGFEFYGYSEYGRNGVPAKIELRKMVSEKDGEQ